MGAAKLRVIEEGRPASVDFAAMDLPYAVAFLRLASGDGADCEGMQIVRLLAGALIGAKWRGNLNGRDADQWQVWEIALDNGAPTVPEEMNVGALAWMKALAGDPALSVPFYLVRAREAFCDVLTKAIEAAKTDTKEAEGGG